MHWTLNQICNLHATTQKFCFSQLPTLNTFVYTGRDGGGQPPCNPQPFHHWKIKFRPLPDKSASCAPAFTRPTTFKFMISICQRHFSSQNSNSHITFFFWKRLTYFFWKPIQLFWCYKVHLDLWILEQRIILVLSVYIFHSQSVPINMGIKWRFYKFWKLFIFICGFTAKVTFAFLNSETMEILNTF